MPNTHASLKPFHLKYVSHHVNQTHLVEELLQKQILSYDDLSGWEPDEEDQYPDIYQ